jgi:hypothetical protein
MSLDEACGKFAGKLSAAQAAGDTQKAQTIYQQLPGGLERGADRQGHLPAAGRAAAAWAVSLTAAR